MPDRIDTGLARRNFYDSAVFGRDFQAPTIGFFFKSSVSFQPNCQNVAGALALERIEKPADQRNGIGRTAGELPIISSFSIFFKRNGDIRLWLCYI